MFDSSKLKELVDNSKPSPNVFKLSNSKVYNKLLVKVQGTVVGQITKSNGKYSYHRLISTPETIHERLLVGLSDSSSHTEVLNFMKGSLTYTERRADRHTLFPSWVSHLEDEIYVTRGQSADVPALEVEYA